jgi:hypothetical protein
VDEQMIRVKGNSEYVNGTESKKSKLLEWLKW